MPKNRSQKQQELAKLAECLGKMKSVVLSTTTGLKVSDVTKLRKLMRAEGGEYLVVKKTLLTRAFEKSGVAFPELEGVKASFALSFGFEDEVAPAKLLSTFRKDHESLQFLGGIVAGTAYSAEQIAALAKLPTRHELLAKLVGTLNAPLSGLVNVAVGPLRGFVQVLKARSEAATKA